MRRVDEEGMCSRHRDEAEPVIKLAPRARKPRLGPPHRIDLLRPRSSPPRRVAGTKERE